MNQREQFKHKVYAIWSQYFGQAIDTSIMGNIQLSVFADFGADIICLYCIEDRLIVQCGEPLADSIRIALESLNKDVSRGSSVTVDDFKIVWRDKQIIEHSIGKMYYLYADDFRPATTSHYVVRQLNVNDHDALDLLKSACTEAEVDEGWVHVTDELAFGAFTDEKLMVACASMYDWRGFADPGVLVHPEYRRLGLGKVVVSQICDWVLTQERVMTYRCDSENVGSARIADQLGFTHYFNMDYFKVFDNA